MRIGNKTKISAIVIAGVLILGFMLPERLVIPVQGATAKDWNHNTFWFEPWGSSGVHKGIDIFSAVGTPVVASTYGVVLFKGSIEKGGNVVAILGPKWRIHYYAHLNEINEGLAVFIGSSEIIGGVGNSGNANNKPSHLHYTILTLLPYIWSIDTSTQGWKKAFFLNPSERLLENRQ
jgi:murein DD-endopeptidase MepM/ murein hydrolase activator NlpD